MNTLYLFALANFALCSAIGFVAVCRLNAMDKSVLIRVKAEYVGYFAAGTVSGFQPWIGEWPGWATLGMSGGLLMGLLCSAHAWRHQGADEPPVVATGHGEFDPLEPKEKHETRLHRGLARLRRLLFRCCRALRAC